MVGARVRRQQVAYAQARGLSGRRACALLTVARSTLGYQSRLATQDTPVLAAMRRVASQYPRYGYRRIRIFLRREGHAMSPDRAHRLWRQAGLQVPRRRPRRRVASGRPRPLPPTAQNHVWAYDVVCDTCANGQPLKCLTVVDEWTRECLAIDVAGGIRSGRVIEVLAQLVSLHGPPRYLRSDNGPEFVATAILRWLTDAQIETAHIDPGKPWQNATDESFNGKFRDEHLSLQCSATASRPRSGSSSGGGTTTTCGRIRRVSDISRRSSSRRRSGTRPPVGGARWRCQLALTRTNTETYASRRGPFSSNHWSEECRQVTSNQRAREELWRYPSREALLTLSSRRTIVDCLSRAVRCPSQVESLSEPRKRPAAGGCE
jgi:putative transposase